MAYVHVLSCDRCGYQWRWLQLNSEEPIPPCANPKCSNQVVTQELAAPGVARGAAPETSFAIPQTRKGREEFAWQMAQGMGFTNMKDNLREGDVQAPPPPEVEITAPNGRKIKAGAGFSEVGQTPEAVASSIMALTGGGGGAAVNRPAMRMLGAIKGR